MAPETAHIDGPRREAEIGGSPVVGKIVDWPKNGDNDGGDRGYS